MGTAEKFEWAEGDLKVVLPEDTVQATIARIDEILGADQTFSDAGPSSLYVSRPVLNGKELLDWARKQGIPELVEVGELHVTIAHSTRPLDWMEVGAPWEETIDIPAGGPRVVEVFGTDAIVLRFASSHLLWRHREILEAGASWDFAQYCPHVTVGRGSLDGLTITPFAGRIQLGPEIFEEVKLEELP